MNCVRLGVGVTLLVALATASWAQERAEPMQFAPDEVRPDAGAAETTEAPAAAPQEEDRESAPITKGATKTAPKPAAVAAPPPSKPAPPPKPDKPKKQQAKK